MNLGKKLLELMRNFNVSESNLASAINIDQTTLNKIINNKTTNPRIETVKSLSKYFNVDINELINESGSDEDDHNEDFATILKKLIVLNNNPSISCIAKESGVSKSIISNILNNKTTKPNVTTIKKLMTYFNVEMSQFGNQHASAISQNPIKADKNISLFTVPVIDIINIYDYANSLDFNIEITKYIKATLPVALKNSFAVQIVDNEFLPEFMPPCYLIVAKQEPFYNGFVFARLENNTLIYKFKSFNEYVNLQEINSTKIIRLSKDNFSDVFIGSIYQTIVDYNDDLII